MDKGTKFGPYEILGAAGAGGMGEVYRARDTRLDRTVAIKVLPAHLSSDPSLRARFDKEAKAISSLQHPHVCTLFDVGQQDGRDFLVMEFLEGETLERRIARGALPPEELLRTAIQIADALDKAHRGGIIHRDLKPGNVMLTKTGAKLMDFGLAKSAGESPVAAARTAMSTQGRKLTEEGSIVGTFQYMAPEQLEGQEADSRTDIFAFGALLYEMATGTPPFTGRTKASLIAAILSSEPPPIASLQPLTPPPLDRLVRICLAKDADERFQNIHDLKLQLQWVAEGGSQVNAPAPVVLRRKQREGLAWGLAGLLLVALIAASSLLYQHTHAKVRVVKAAVLPPPDTRFTVWGASNAPMPSPDGTRLAFIAARDSKAVLYVQALDSLEAHSVPNSEGATYPFWAPDGRYLAFFSDGKLRRVGINGESPRTICDASDARGGSWGKNGEIIFANSRTGPLSVVAADGGKPRELTKLRTGDASHRWPYFLPDGRHFLYLSSPTGTDNADNGVRYASMDGKEDREVLRGSTSAMFSRGHLLFWREGSLYGQAFDPDQGVLSGDPFSIATGVAYDGLFSHAIFSTSDSGVLVYQPGTAFNSSQIWWLDLHGKPLRQIGELGLFNQVTASPDGKTIAVSMLSNGNTLDIWLFDDRGVKTRFTFKGSRNAIPSFTPDGRTIYYASNQAGKMNIYRKPTDGSSEETLVLGGEDKFSMRLSPDGKYLTYMMYNTDSKLDVYVFPLAPGGSPTLFLHGSYNEANPYMSPDSHWLVYQSDESGRYEIYATPVPGPGAKFQISSGGGLQPQWSVDGKHIYFLNANTTALVSVAVQQKANSLVLGKPEELFKFHPRNVNVGVYHVARDGRVLVNLGNEDTTAPVIVVSDWLAAAQH